MKKYNVKDKRSKFVKAMLFGILPLIISIFIGVLVSSFFIALAEEKNFLAIIRDYEPGLYKRQYDTLKKHLEDGYIALTFKNNNLGLRKVKFTEKLEKLYDGSVEADYLLDNAKKIILNVLDSQIVESTFLHFKKSSLESKWSFLNSLGDIFKPRVHLLAKRILKDLQEIVEENKDFEHYIVLCTKRNNIKRILCVVKDDKSYVKVEDHSFYSVKSTTTNEVLLYVLGYFFFK